MDELKTYKRYYFKVPHGGPELMSGLPLPKPGAYKFVNCVFHPAIEHIVHDPEGLYKGSVFTNY